MLLLGIWHTAQGAITPSSQDLWITSLSQCESQQRSDITVLDTNNKFSYGLLQFQLATFMKFGKIYEVLPNEFTNKEGLLLIQVCKKQSRVQC